MLRYNLAIERAQQLLGTRVFSGLAGIADKWTRLGKLRKYLELAGKPLESRYRGISSYEQLKKQRRHKNVAFPDAQVALTLRTLGRVKLVAPRCEEAANGVTLDGYTIRTSRGDLATGLDDGRTVDDDVCP